MTQARYKLTYWPTSFRGCFVSYLFAYKGVSLVIDDDMKAIRQRKELSPGDQVLPWMGPPLLEDLDTGRAMTQTPAIIQYYAPQLGLLPDDSYHAARCMKIQMDCNDLLMEICRYNGTSMWQRQEWIAFRTSRLPRWMAFFEEELKGGMIGADQVNFADIATYALFGNMIRCLPELENDLLRHAPGVHALCRKIGSEPSLAAFVAQEEQKYGKSYCAGQIEESIRQQLALDA